MEPEVILVTHSGFLADSIYLVRANIGDRKELRELRRLPASWLRGSDDIADSGNELFCPGGIIVKRDDGYLIAWELRRNIGSDSMPDAGTTPGWKHLIDAGFRPVTMSELSPLVGWDKA